MIHTAAMNVGVMHVVCVCGKYFETHAYNGTGAAQFARHLREENNGGAYVRDCRAQELLAMRGDRKGRA